jgi:4-alpha-glucanotransferase
MSLTDKRAAGILLAVSSLPSPYGIGTFGETARNWVRFLKDAGQKYWQILPLGPTGWGDSPYQSFSAFAISPYYIDIEYLCDDGYLPRMGNMHTEHAQDNHAESVQGNNPSCVDYAYLFNHRYKLLRTAYKTFAAKNGFEQDDYKQFVNENNFWLEDYSLYMAIKNNYGNLSWLDWPHELKMRDDSALQKIKIELNDEIQCQCFMQWAAFSQWKKLKTFANENGIKIIGDIPIYAALDSADTWANSEIFQLDENKHPTHVAGCPPDPFAAGGQLWGNPLYNWEKIAKDDFAWWISRLGADFRLYDVLRIDHFRGLESYFSIPANDRDARRGEWKKGPGAAFVQAVRRAMPNAQIIAEDLGYLTSEVKALLAASGFPGMKVLQFAFDSREASDYMPYTYSPDCVVYTGTHDNPTSLGWFQSARPEDAALALDFFGLKDATDGNWAFIRAALSSVARLSVIPMQDYLGLSGDGARMNTPSTLGSNWLWRMTDGGASSHLAAKIARLTKINGR